MKAVKTFLFVLGGLFAALCIFVLVAAFNPEFTKKLSSGIGSLEKEYKNEELSGDIPTGNPQETEDVVVPPVVIEEGYDENGLRNPYAEKLHYEVPDTELEVPKDMAGIYGYIPMAGREDLAQQEPGNEEAYGETGENLDFDTTIYPYYGMLSDGLQRVYRQVYANAVALNETFVPLENLSAVQMQNVMEAVYNDHPELFWLDTAFSCKYYRNGICKELTLKFNWTAEQLEDCQREFTDAVNDIVYGAINYTEDFEKERYVHDALLGRIKYNLAADIGQSAYSALVGRETVCAGYSRAYQYILQKLGIPCYYCTGYAGENHAWNIVKLGNAYYNVDVTWDDVEPNSYDYFNQTDKVFSKDHVRTGLSVYLPACKGTKYQKQTEGRKPNTWQNSSGNQTDQSGKTYYPESDWGDGVGYDGQLLTSLQDYYDNCKSQLSKGGMGTVIFYNVVDSETLEEILAAYNSGDYKKGYLSEVLRNMNAFTGKVTVVPEIWKDAETTESEDSTDKTTGTIAGTTTGESETETSTEETETGESETEETEEENGGFKVDHTKQYILRHVVVIE